MSESKTLKSILGDEVSIPKSYTRYLDYTVVSQQQQNIFIKTPKGNTLIFKIEDNSLKKLTATSYLEIQTPKDQSVTTQNTQQQSSGLNDNAKKSLRDFENRIQTLESDAEKTKNIEKRLEVLEKNMSGDYIHITPGQWQDVKDQLQKVGHYQQETAKLENRLQILEDKLFQIEKIGVKTEPSKAKENAGKIAKHSAKVVTTGSKFLWQRPKLLGALVVIVVFLIWQPWSYFSDWSSSQENNQSSTNYIIPKKNLDKNKNKSNIKSTRKKSRAQEDDGNYLSPQDKKYAEEQKNVSSAVKTWVNQLESMPVKERENSVRKLGISRDPSAGQVLIVMLKDAEISWSAVKTLGEMRYRPAVPALVTVLEDTRKAPHVRSETCTTLGVIGNTYTSKLLKKIFLDEKENEEVRLNAGLALGTIGYANAAPDILEALGNRNPIIKQAAVTALGKFQYPAAVIPIIDILNTTEDFDLMTACIDALGKIRSKANMIAPVLADMLEKGDSDLEEHLKASLRNLSSRLKPELKKRVAELIQE